MPKLLPVVKIEAFEGPFDLVLELVRAGKMSLDTISLGSLTQSFLEQWQKQPTSPELQSNFVSVASMLVLMKIQRLLPKLEREEEIEIEDLEKRLEIYAVFRREALRLRHEWNRHRMVGRGEDPALQRKPAAATAASIPYSAAELAQLCRALFEALPRPRMPMVLTPLRRYTLQQAWVELTKRLRGRKRVILQQVIEEQGRHSMASIFLSALEMARRQEVQLHQEKEFDHIILENSRI